MKRSFLTFVVFVIAVCSDAQDRWSIQPDGSILWKIDGRLPHADHIEMAGEKVAVWMQYEVDSSGRAKLNRSFIFPTYRLLPQQTIAHMMYDVKDEELPRFIINGKLLYAGTFSASVQAPQKEKVISIRQKGVMEIQSLIGKDGSLQLTRRYFPSVDKPMAVEQWVFTNNGREAVKLEMESMQRESSPAASRTKDGPHHFVMSTVGAGEKIVQPGDSIQFAILYQAVRGTEQALVVNVDTELAARKARVQGILSNLILETPDSVLNTMFAFARIRATESIYKTKGGYMHGPGGLRYYAAIWANDQAEYANPYFAFSGDDIANKSAMNAYRWFAHYMNPDYKPIPSSIIAEGDGTWHGAKDRGDMAMIAYGAGRYALAFGNADSARVLFPLIEGSLEYLRRQLNDEGVVKSNSDELENRFPAGPANLNTSSLYYDALLSASYLARELQLPAAKIKDYASRAATMRKNIDAYFGHKVEGFDTYRYYKGNDTLRAWIATPLTVGLFERKKGTIEALFSPRLWTQDGLASLAGNQTFWDRSTLYGLRGAFAAGETDKALSFLEYYSRRRLLGEHVPYAVEAYPEGNQRHLSAESALYARIFTEGLFGIRPVGFRSFTISPRLPSGWKQLKLNRVAAFGSNFDLTVTRNKTGSLKLYINNQGKTQTVNLKEGETVKISL